MATGKKIKDQIKTAFTLAKPTKSFFVLHMPDEVDASPHWLFWVFIIAFLVLVGSLIYSRLSLDTTIQAYLPQV